MIRAAAVALSALVLGVFVSPLFGAGAIFPAPIHITREVHDPISDRTIVLNEYGYGNRLISVRDHVTAIADYEKGELTEIDRDAGTYSVTRFDTIARAAQAAGGPTPIAATRTRERDLKGIAAKETKSGRPADFFRADGEEQSYEVALDRSVRISKEALEVLLGAAYPGTRAEQHDVVIAAAGRGRNAIASDSESERSYALPLEQLIESTAGQERIVFRNSVLRVASEPPPADVLAIPAGARLVSSRVANLLREIEQIDAKPLTPPKQP